MLEHGMDSPSAPARTVIVGAQGFVGNAIAANLEALGTEVVRVGRADVDLMAPDAAERLAGLIRSSDAVVLAAAKAPVKTPAMLRENIVLIEALAGAIAKVQPAYVLNIGSDAVYADSEEPLTEASCRSPTSLHGLMHLAREVMLAEACGQRSFATLRPTLIYGAEDPHNGYGPNRFRRQAAAGEPIKLFGEGEERRDHVWVEDVAELAAQMVLHRSRGALNAATGQVVSFRDIAKEIRSLYDNRSKIESLPRQGPMPHGGYRPFDAAATRAAFPDFTYTPLREGLKSVHAQLA